MCDSTATGTRGLVARVPPDLPPAAEGPASHRKAVVDSGDTDSESQLALPPSPPPPKDLPWEDAVGSGDANNEPHPGDHLPRPPLRVSHERTCHPAPALSPRGLRAGGWCRRRGEKGAPQGQAKLRQGRSTLTLGWALRACRRPISLLQEAGSGCAGASPRLGGAGRNLTHCTGHPHRRALGPSPSRGLGGHGSHQGSRQPPDPLAPRVAAPVPPWHEADKDSRHQCGVDKVCS